MLYISSRNKTDSFTAHRTLCNDRAPDGGLFIPYQIPVIDAAELQRMRSATFSENMAFILNLFFSCKLTAWDVECCIGRAPVRLMEMSYRLLTAECFHNPKNAYSYLEDSLFQKLCLAQTNCTNTGWARIAVRIAVLFAIHAIMPESIGESFDVALTTGDFSGPMAAWYARKMGLPVRMIICCCNENGAAWDLIQRGEFNTGMPLVDTGMKDMDNPCPEQIERLIFHTLGLEQTTAYIAVCRKRGVFRLTEMDFDRLSDGFAASVVGQDRITATIRSVYRTNQYLISPSTAIAYGGLQDYRSRSGESRYTLVLADRSPVVYADEVCQACGITRSALTKAFTSGKE